MEIFTSQFIDTSRQLTHLENYIIKNTTFFEYWTYSSRVRADQSEDRDAC